jgi:hypothetical protein
VIVRLDADGAVVAEADDCTTVHVETDLDAAGLQAALLDTGTGSVPGWSSHGVGGGEPAVAVLDIAVLRSRAQLVTSAPDWAERFDRMVTDARDRLTDDGLGLGVPVERPAG